MHENSRRIDCPGSFKESMKLILYLKLLFRLEKLCPSMDQSVKMETLFLV